MRTNNNESPDKQTASISTSPIIEPSLGVETEGPGIFTPGADSSTESLEEPNTTG